MKTLLINESQLLELASELAHNRAADYLFNDELITNLKRFGSVTAGVIEGVSEDIVVSAKGYLASYDLKITQTDGVVTRLLFGDVCFSQEITQ
jgi:hypothetical protein